MLLALLLGQEDSTGQRITFIVIGLLVAALLLAILTAWYYRITDPGPRQARKSPSTGGSRGGGANRTRGPEPVPGPGWRKRLSRFSVPPSEPEEAAPEVRAEPVSERPTQAPTATESVQSQGRRTAEAAGESGGSNPDAVSLEGGYYLDLRDSQPSPEPGTNVGSLSSLDLRQPAPLKDPAEQPSGVPVPTVPEPSEQEAVQSKPKDDGLSFDEWLAGVEAIEDQ